MIDGPYILGKEPFQFSYKDTEDQVTARFQPWLEERIILGIDQWRRQI